MAKQQSKMFLIQFKTGWIFSVKFILFFYFVLDILFIIIYLVKEVCCHMSRFTIFAIAMIFLFIKRKNAVLAVCMDLKRSYKSNGE